MAAEKSSKLTAEELVSQLETELRTARQELEKANEELRSTNEEMLAGNEELRTTSDELAATSERTRGLNAALATSNAALRDKVAQLASANNDLANLIDSTDLATVFLDRNLRLTRFTPAASRLFGLMPAHVGWPMSTFARHVLNEHLLQDAETVLRDFTPQQRDLTTRDGHCCIRRVLPYRTVDNRIDGVVVTFADVTVLKRSEEALRRLNEELERRVDLRTEALQRAVEQLQAEIAERRQAQEENRRLAALIASSNDAIIGKSLDGVILTWNAAAERLYGYTAAETVGRSIRMLSPPDRPEEVPSLLERLRRGERIEPFRTRRVRKDGRQVIISLSLSPWKDAAGQTVGASAIARDITEQERLEQMMRLQGRIAAHLAEGVTMVRQRDGALLWVNERFEQMFGYGPGELLGKTVVELNAPSGNRSAEETAQAIIAALRENGEWKGEVHNVRKGGTPFWTHASVSSFDHAEHGPVWISVQSDITERKQAEQDLSESRERLRTVLETAADAILTINQSGVVESVNSAAERLFGYAAAEMVGRNVNLLMPSPYREEHDGYLRRFLATGVARIIGTGREVRCRRKDGSIFPADLAVSVVAHLGLYTGILHDATARKELERQVLEAATAEQQRIGQELHDSVGQELTALGLLAEGLVESLRGQEPASGLAVRVAAGLKRTLGEVRTLSRGLVPVDVGASGLMAALAELAAHTGEAAGVRCVFDCPEPVPVEDDLTAKHLYRIAQEAVANALRHGRARQVLIGLEGDDQGLELRVCDDGVGIAATGQRGPGLGLKIMHYRAGLINARLSVERVEPSGTQVTCILSKENGHERAGRPGAGNAGPGADRGRPPGGA
jgi:PAS domain S-box-containing protein